MKSKNGFTLIELLIVVLIIAILAAIAVPNFLEFQIRAKVSRVLSDHRALATAIEAYTVDNNRPPIDGNHGRDALGRWTNRDDWVQQVTTPIAYITTQFLDVFAEHGRSTAVGGSSLAGELGYNYRCFEDPVPSATVVQELRSLGYYWGVRSIGPDAQANTPYVQNVFRFGNPGLLYDPTNGTVSSGDLWRCNKGIVTGNMVGR